MYYISWNQRQKIVTQWYVANSNKPFIILKEENKIILTISKFHRTRPIMNMATKAWLKPLN